MNILEVRGLNKEFKEFKLKDISFHLEPGYIMGYVGQNGAGKTTTINLINHLKTPDSGEIKVNGISYEDNPVLYKEYIGYIGDESYFPEQFTIKNVRNTLKDFYKTFDEKVFDDYVDKWKLNSSKKIGEFSRGMKVKLMFAGALSRDTKILILDEATNGLDPVMRSEILEILQDYISDGERSVLFSTHILNDLEQIADYIFFIDNGEKVMFDTKDELLEKFLLVKGGNDDLTEELDRKLIGKTKTSIGFEALIRSDDAVFTNNNLLLEKPSIDEIVIRYIKNMK